jgi:predicted methyltransferase
MTKKTWVFLLGAALLLGAGYAVMRGGRPHLGLGRGGRQAGRERRLHRDAEVALKAAASQAVLAYVKAPGGASLDAALKACLSAREQVPSDVFLNFLTAFCRHEQKDRAGEAEALSAYSEEYRGIYRFIFYEHRAELADGLYLLPAQLCKRLRESYNADKVFGSNGARCPSYGGPVLAEKYSNSRGTFTRYRCPKCDAMLEAGEKEFLGNKLLRMKGGNPLRSVLNEVAHGLLDDRLRSESDRSDLGPAAFIALAGVKPGDAVADIGCGIGYMTYALSRAVGPNGRVYAEDIDAALISLVRYAAAAAGDANIVPVLGTPTDMGFKRDSLDKAVLLHVYRGILEELDGAPKSDRDAFFDGFLANIRKGLKKGGVLVIADRLDERFGMSREAVSAELQKRGFRYAGDRSDSPDKNMVLLFEKI